MDVYILIPKTDFLRLLEKNKNTSNIQAQTLIQTDDTGLIAASSSPQLNANKQTPSPFDVKASGDISGGANEVSNLGEQTITASQKSINTVHSDDNDDDESQQDWSLHWENLHFAK